MPIHAQSLVRLAISIFRRIDAWISHLGYSLVDEAQSLPPLAVAAGHSFETFPVMASRS